MRRTLAIIAVLSVFATPALATQLLMIEEDGCEWCVVWNEEVGVVYANTDEGRKAPLVRHDIHTFSHDALALNGSVRYTPTFIVIENQKEVGRIVGYPGESFFWQLLDQILEKTATP